ncbi:MAG: hypothetical protein MJZ79_06765 [Paludibacteraceae bacterium]|nr:hypothetical protein [Paludibacteraceae bacterium]
MKKSKSIVIHDFIMENFENGGAFRFDVLSGKTQMRATQLWEDVTDRDLCTIAYRCSEETNMNVSPKDILNVLQSNDVVAAVHPLRDYLERLPQYDPQCGMDFIELMSDHVRVVGNEDAQQMWKRCFRRWFLSMVQSWRKDEVVNHQVLVLIGPQGIYKTTWLEHILPPELRAYQCKQASSRELSKDDRIRIAENALINLDEIDAMSPRELNVLKSVITAADINERAAYGYTKQRRVRCASFCASGNNKQFLNDDTGNRRWLPFEVESIDSPFDTDMMMPYQMLYAQAVYELEHGAAYYFDRDETDALSQHNETFRMPRNEEDLLPVYFRAATREDAEAKFMTASEIHGRLKVVGNIEKLMPINKFGLLLQKNGFVQTAYKGIRGYIVVETSTPMQSQKEMAQELLTKNNVDTF